MTILPHQAASLASIALAVQVAACATAPHDTLGFKGIVYSRDVQSAEGRTIAIPTGSGTTFANFGGGAFVVYILKLDDGTTYAVRSSQLFEVGSCLAVYMSAERSKSAGYLNIKDTTVLPASGCKASITQ